MKAYFRSLLGIAFALGMTACASNDNENAMVRGEEDCSSREVYINEASACSKPGDVRDLRDMGSLQSTQNQGYGFGGGYGFQGQEISIENVEPGCDFPGINPYTGETVMGKVGTRDLYMGGYQNQQFGGGYGCPFGGEPATANGSFQNYY